MIAEIRLDPKVLGQPDAECAARQKPWIEGSVALSPIVDKPWSRTIEAVTGLEPATHGLGNRFGGAEGL